MNKKLVLQLLVAMPFLMAEIKASETFIYIVNKSGRHMYVGDYGSLVVDRVPAGQSYPVCEGASYLVYPKLPAKDAKIMAISISFGCDNRYGVKTMTVENGMQVGSHQKDLEAYQGVAQIKPGFIHSNE